MIASPIIAQGLTIPPNPATDVVFVGDEGSSSNNPTLWALNANTANPSGAVLWSQSIATARTGYVTGLLPTAGVSSTAFFDQVSKNYVYVAGSDGKLYAVNAIDHATGNWSAQVTDSNHLGEYVWGGINSDGNWIYMAMSFGIDECPQGSLCDQGKVVAVKAVDNGLGRTCYPISPNYPNCKVVPMWDLGQFPNNEGSGIWGYGGPSISTRVLV